MYKAFVFDLDGTLIDSLESIGNLFNAHLEKMGLKPCDMNLYNEFVGGGARVLAIRAFNYINERDNLNLDEEGIMKKVEEILPDYLYDYNNRDDRTTKPYEKIVQSLTKLKEEGKVLAVCTNKPLSAAVNVLDNIFGENFFDYIFADNKKIKLKPETDMVDELKRVSGLKDEEMIYFGDTCTDMKTAVKSNIFPVGVTWGFRTEEELLESGAKAIIHKPEEILKFLK